MALNRRHILQAGLAGTGLLHAPMLWGQAAFHVVVVGGGAGGSTIARLLATSGVRVSLIEPNPKYHTCFLSNLYLGGLREHESLTFGYDTLIAEGVTLVPGRVVAVDRDARKVRLESGEVLAYDRLVLAPGIDFAEGAVPGWSLAEADRMPHAYKAPDQTQLLRDQIDAMPQGGTFAMIAPPNPYRCPPAPYERVSMIAHRLKQTNPSAKILIFDPKDKFTKQTLFENGWGKYYNGMVTWFGPEFGATDVEVRPSALEVVVDGEVQKVDVCNVIPAQIAGQIAHLAGITDETGWAPVDPFSLRSRADPLVYVIGDSAAQGDMPKSAFAANSHAHAAASAILAEMAGTPAPDPSYANACWSLLAPNDAVKITETFHATVEKIVSDEVYISAPNEPAEIRSATAEEGLHWYDGITADIFG
jgi:sulfide dehydrogenase [flavocytochrome c] flavoprotein chain